MESKDELQKIRIGAVEQLGAIPRVLKELQELVPLLAVTYSTDGRTFGYEAPLSMAIPVGSYVALSVQDGREYLGQVITKEVSGGSQVRYLLAGGYPASEQDPRQRPLPVRKSHTHEDELDLGSRAHLADILAGTDDLPGSGATLRPGRVSARRKDRAEPDLRRLRGTLLRRGRYRRAHFMGGSAEGHLMRAGCYTEPVTTQDRTQTGDR